MTIRRFWTSIGGACLASLLYGLAVGSVDFALVGYEHVRAVVVGTLFLVWIAGCSRLNWWLFKQLWAPIDDAKPSTLCVSSRSANTDTRSSGTTAGICYSNGNSDGTTVADDLDPRLYPPVFE